jgi:hypothetical protein
MPGSIPAQQSDPLTSPGESSLIKKLVRILKGAVRSGAERVEPHPLIEHHTLRPFKDRIRPAEDCADLLIAFNLNDPRPPEEEILVVVVVDRKELVNELLSALVPILFNFTEPPLSRCAKFLEGLTGGQVSHIKCVPSQSLDIVLREPDPKTATSMPGPTTKPLLNPIHQAVGGRNQRCILADDRCTQWIDNSSFLDKLSLSQHRFRLDQHESRKHRLCARDKTPGRKLSEPVFTPIRGHHVVQRLSTTVKPHYIPGSLLPNQMVHPGALAFITKPQSNDNSGPWHRLLLS